MSRSARRPLSPEAAAVVSALRPSRRGVLASGAALGAGALLTACGTGGSSSGKRTLTAAQDVSDSEKYVRWANWTSYLDYDEETKVYPTLERFQKQTGIKATYAEDIEDNDQYWGKIQGQLRNGQDIGKDIVVFTDYMAARMIRLGYSQEIDRSVVPNAKNLLPELSDVSFDRGRKNSLTWQSGFAGLAYNKAELNKLGVKIETVSDLWNPKLKGRVEVLTEMRDTIGLILLEQGVDVSEDFSGDQWKAAVEVLRKQLDNGQVRQVKGNSYLEDLKSGAALAVIAWSGDIFAANGEAVGDKDIEDPYEFVIPDSGGTIWSDNMLIPIGSPHRKNAEILMNYYYDPAVAAEVAAWVQYICPVQGAREAMTKVDASLVDSPFIFPDEATLKRVKVFRDLSPQEETEFNEEFQKVLGA
ncbi:MAG: spermidine/putrescine ABC transporter substrate-binding protein [Kineosporiaceae bacterium]